MNKKISISVLGISIASLMAVGFGVFLNQPKYDLIDIQGDKSNIGNGLFVSQSSLDLYSHIQTITSKDGFKVEKYKKYKNFEGNYYDLLSKHKDLFGSGIPSQSSVYNSKNNIGYIEGTNTDYSQSGNATIELKIMNKNLNTNEINEYIVKLPDTFDGNTNFENSFTVSLKNEDLYILDSGQKDIEYGNNGSIKKVGSSFINVYKFNMKTQEIKKQDELILSNKDKEYALATNNIIFSNNNKMYTSIEKIDSKNKKNKNCYLVYYDISKGDFEYIKEAIITDENLNLINGEESIDYKVEDNKLYVIQKGQDDYESSNIKQSTVDLNDNKVIAVDKTYKIPKFNKLYDITSFRVIDNKLYLCISSYNDDTNRYEGHKDWKNNIIVLDEKTGKLLYMGEYVDDIPELVGTFILKKSEI